MKAKSMKKLLLMVFLIFCSLIFVFPFYTMIMMSTYYSEDIYKGIPLLPGGYLLENLKTVFSAHFEVFYINSLITAVNKWLIGHAEGGFTGSEHIGLIGKNLNINE